MCKNPGGNVRAQLGTCQATAVIRKKKSSAQLLLNDAGRSNDTLLRKKENKGKANFISLSLSIEYADSLYDIINENGHFLRLCIGVLSLDKYDLIFSARFFS